MSSKKIGNQHQLVQQQYRRRHFSVPDKQQTLPALDEDQSNSDSSFEERRPRSKSGDAKAYSSLPVRSKTKSAPDFSKNRPSAIYQRQPSPSSSIQKQTLSPVVNSRRQTPPPTRLTPLSSAVNAQRLTPPPHRLTPPPSAVNGQRLTPPPHRLTPPPGAITRTSSASSGCHSLDSRSELATGVRRRVKQDNSSSSGVYSRASRSDETPTCESKHLSQTIDSLQTSLDTDSLNCQLHNGSAMSTPIRDPGGKMAVKMRQGQATPNKGNRKQPQPFENYFSLEQVQQGLKRGELIEGVLRINPKSYEDAYISAPDGQMDIYIGGILDRNRAMNGDQVAVQVKPQSHWKVLNDVFINHMRNLDRETEICNYYTCDSVVSDKDNNNSECKVNLPGPSKVELHKENQVPCLAQSPANCKGVQSNPPGDGVRNGPKYDTIAHSAEAGSAVAGPQQAKKKNRRAPRKNKKNKTNLETASESVNNPIGAVIGNEVNIGLWTPSDAAPEPTPPEGPASGWGKAPVSQVPWCDANQDGGFVPGGPWGVSDTPNPPGDVVILSPTAIQHLMDYKQREKNVEGSSSPPPAAVVVAPDQLTDLEFSDSVSETSSGSQDLSRVLEDSEFISTQLLNPNLPAPGFDPGPGVSLEELNSASKCLPVDGAKQDGGASSSLSLDAQVASLNIADSSNKESKERKVRQRRRKNKKTTGNPEQFAGNQPKVAKSGSAEGAVSNQSRQNKTVPPANRIASPKKAGPSRANQTPAPSNSTNQTPARSNSSNQTPARSNSSNQQAGSNYNNGYKRFDVAKVLTVPNSSRFVQKLAKVVCVVRETHPRVAAGHIQPMQDKNPDILLFCPRDHRVPRMMVPSVDCPGFHQHPDRFKNVLFLAKMTSWENSGFAKGRLCQMLGVDGDLQGETVAILIENGVDFSEFPETIYQGIPDPGTWCIPQAELDARRDLRSTCIFTIDPATTRDIDDAMSCDRLPDGRYRVGVHIADVSFFVLDSTELDQFAADRATSVYLIHQVIPMLPRALCNQLCSLNPSTDRLTFSVEWVLNEQGEVLEEWFGRTVIRSCSKLSYEHAQEMIDTPGKRWQPEEHPPVTDGFTIDDVAARVRHLNDIAVHLRRARFDGGALKLDQVKLIYDIDPETGLPRGFDKYEHSESHRLIEEFMLLANMAVANKIYSKFPDLAVLRCHPEPQSKPLDDVMDLCEAMGLPIDGSSAGTLHRSLSQYVGDQDLAAARFQVLTHLCTKPMKLARYFCAGWTKDEEQFRHYALNVPLYTHFTSPIRRYPDIMVHRQLAAALGYCDLRDKSVPNLHKEAEHCNDKKTAAKRVQEQSGELYLALYIQLRGPFRERAMVVSVLDKAVDLLVMNMGIVKRAYTDKLPLRNMKFENLRNVNRLTLTWEGSPPITQPLTVFSLVHVLVEGANEPLKFNVILQVPDPS